MPLRDHFHLPFRGCCTWESFVASPIVILVLVTAGGAQEPPAKRLDVHGDALPAGAIARIGALRFRHDGPVGCPHFSGDGKTLLGDVSNYGPACRLWDVETGKQLPEFRGKPLGYARLSPDGKFLIDQIDGAARLWDVESGKVLRTWGGDSDPKDKDDFSVSWPCFSRDGKLLIIPGKQGEKDLIRRFNLNLSVELRQYEMPADSFNPYGQLSPDGRLLLEVLYDDNSQPSLGLVNLDTGKKLHTFENSPEPTSYWWGTEFSPDGKTLIGLAEEREIFIWNAATGKLIRRMQNGKAGFRMRGPTFSLDGKLFTVNDGSDYNVLIYDLATGKLLQSVSNGGLHNQCVFSPNSKLLLAPSTSEIAVWDVATGNKVCRFDFEVGAGGAESSVAFSPDGKRIAFTSDRFLKVADVATGKLLHADDAGSQFMPAALVFSQNGKSLTLADDNGAFHAWDAATGKHVRAFSKPDGGIPAEKWALDCPRDGRLLAALNGLDDLAVWDVHAGKAVQRFDDDIRCWFRKSAFSADARLLATTSDNSDIHVFDIAAGNKLHRFQWYAKPAEAVRHWGNDQPMLAFSPDGRSLAALGLSRPSRAPVNKADPHIWVIRIWELATGKERQRFPLGGHEVRPEVSPGAWAGLQWTADGKALAVSNGDVVMFSVATGKEVRRFSGPAGLNGAAAVFSGDGKLLAVPDATGKVYLWETATATLLCDFRCQANSATLLAFSPDSKRLATAGTDATVVVWDLEYFLKRGPADRQQLEASWHALADADAAKAFQAIALLTKNPRDAVALLKERIVPAALPDPKRFHRLLADLGSPQFAVRQKASQELEKLQELAEPGLQKALASELDVEARRRLERLLREIAAAAPSPALRQTLRAIEALEQIGSTEARTLLQVYAKGLSGHRATDAAAKALERLAK